MKNVLKFGLCLIVMFIITGNSPGIFIKMSQAEARQVVDMAGRRVDIPDRVTKIACMQGPSYEMVFALGGKDQIYLVREHHKFSYPLANLTNPDLKNYKVISKVGPKSPVNIEEFLRLGAEVVIYWNIPQELQKFDAAGIAAIVVNWSATEPKDLDESIRDEKKKLKFLAKVLGGDAPERFHRWEKYYDEKVSFIRERTSSLPAEKRPGVYIGNSWGSNILATWGAFNSNPFVVDLCGGRFLGVKGPGEFPEITREQILAWAPEFIIVDNHGQKPKEVIKELKTEPVWASLPAVKNDHVYRIPSGVFFLDKGTSAPVFYLWAAQKLHPELFRDVDMTKELKFYFRNFYDFDLTTEEADQAIND